jgi:hypothetical protein
MYAAISLYVHPSSWVRGSLCFRHLLKAGCFCDAPSSFTCFLNAAVLNTIWLSLLELLPTLKLLRTPSLLLLLLAGVTMRCGVLML